MLNNSENNGTEEIGSVTPTPAHYRCWDVMLVSFISIQKQPRLLFHFVWRAPQINFHILINVLIVGPWWWSCIMCKKIHERSAYVTEEGLPFALLLSSYPPVLLHQTGTKIQAQPTRLSIWLESCCRLAEDLNCYHFKDTSIFHIDMLQTCNSRNASKWYHDDDFNDSVVL